MTQPKFTAYALPNLPTGQNIDMGGIYFIPITGDKNLLSLHIRKEDNSGWWSIGTIDTSSDVVNTVNNLTGHVGIDLSFESGILKIQVTGMGSPTSVTDIDLDARYRKNNEPIPWGDIVGFPDGDFVHKTGNETIGGTKTFTNSPKMPEPTNNTDGANKKYVDDMDSDLQQQITNILNSLGSGMNFVDEIDASVDPDFPVNPDEGTKKGDTWVVTEGGIIGGVSVASGALIIAKQDNASQTNSSQWAIVDSGYGQATETILGIARIAKQEEVDLGENDTKFITPKKLKEYLNNFIITVIEAASLSFVRYDSVQELTNNQKQTARNNIDAASKEDVLWGSKEI